MIYFLRNFSKYLKRYKGFLFLAIISMALVDLVSYAIPMGIEYLTDEIFPAMTRPGMVRELALICVLLLSASLVRGGLSYVMIHFFWAAAELIVRDLRGDLFAKLQRLDLAFYDQARVGDLMSRVSTDIQLIRNFVAYGIEHRLRIILITVTVFLFMLFTNWKLTLATYAMVPFLYAILVGFSKKMGKAVLEKQSQTGALASRIQENLTGIRIVKAFSMEKEEISKFEKENEGLLEKEKKMSFLQMDLNPILLFANGAASLIILLYGGALVIKGSISLGVILAFVSYLGLMGFPMSMLASNTSLFNLAKGAAVRIHEILDCPDEERRLAGDCKEPLKGKVTFKDVNFGYDGCNMTLKNLNFEISPGEKVALFGLTGSGKSTLISLIPKFYPPTSGAIEIDGKNIDEWDLTYLRSKIGIVLQETFLFSTSIKENIAFGKPEASFGEITQAAKHAQIHDFIETLPEGYETVIGEYGAGLSGGQKQRIAIARTLLQDPAILVLDDCTSSLDATTERRIQEQLKELMKGRTTIIISQRMAAFAPADRIIVLNEGSIQDMDSHDRLVRRNTLYRTIYQSQMLEPNSQREGPFA